MPLLLYLSRFVIYLCIYPYYGDYVINYNHFTGADVYEDDQCHDKVLVVPGHSLQVLADLVLEGVHHNTVVGRTEHRVKPVPNTNKPRQNKWKRPVTTSENTWKSGRNW